MPAISGFLGKEPFGPHKIKINDLHGAVYSYEINCKLLYSDDK